MPLLFADREYLTRHQTWPAEFVFFQSFVPQAKASLVPVQHFQARTLLITEYKQSTAKGRQLHFLLNQQGQAIDGFPKIDRLFVQIDFWHIDKHLHHDIALNKVASHTASVPAGRCSSISRFLSNIGWQSIMPCGVNSTKPSLSSCCQASSCRLRRLK